MEVEEVLDELHKLGHPENVAGMARFGITSEFVLGVSKPDLRILARRLGRDHSLTVALWDSGLHEARVLASMVDVPSEVSAEQMVRWVSAFDNWEICDQVTGNLIEREVGDDRNFVKKAVNWALRQVGKRSLALHGPALALARRLASVDSPSGRWIGRDAQKELESQPVLSRLAARNL